MLVADPVVTSISKQLKARRICTQILLNKVKQRNDTFNL